MLRDSPLVRKPAWQLSASASAVLWLILVVQTSSAHGQTERYESRIPRMEEVSRKLLKDFSYCIRISTLQPHHRAAARWVVEWFQVIQNIHKCDAAAIDSSAAPEVRRSIYHILVRSLPRSSESALPNISIEQCKYLALAVSTEVDETMHRLAEWRLDSEVVCREERVRRDLENMDKAVSEKAHDLVDRIKKFTD